MFLVYNFGGRERKGNFWFGFSRSLIVYREVDKKKVLAKAEVWMRKVQVKYYF